MASGWRALVASALIVLPAGVFAGCGGEGSVSEAEVEEKVRTELGKVKGRPPEKIDCPSSLPAKVGASIRCTLEDQGVKYGVTVTATSVDEGDESVRFDAVVDEQPMK